MSPGVAMSPGVSVLGAAIAVGAVLTIAGEESGRRGLVYVCKPLTTALILVLALTTPGGPPSYRALVAAGLLCSLAGDVFLMLPRERFVAGLASFLVAHVWYSVAFATPPSRPAAWWALAALGVTGLVILRALWPGLGRVRWAVVLYVVVILTMAWQAATRWLVTADPRAGAAALGGLLFVASDAVLAIDRFRRPLRHARAIVLATYYAAQALIAVSTGARV
jgi:uncharacterized membrane protein YhhN